jgi:hypothetical protein
MRGPLTLALPMEGFSGAGRRTAASPGLRSAWDPWDVFGRCTDSTAIVLGLGCRWGDIPGNTALHNQRIPLPLPSHLLTLLFPLTFPPAKTLEFLPDVSLLSASTASRPPAAWAVRALQRRHFLAGALFFDGIFPFACLTVCTETRDHAWPGLGACSTATALGRCGIPSTLRLEVRH